MKPILKVLIGALMVITGIFSSLTYSTQLINLIQAVIGPLLILIGAFITWLESDELKLSKEKKSQRGFDVQQSLRDQTSSTKTQKKPGSSAKKDKQSADTTSADKTACPDCGKEFDTERGMKIHRTQKHK